MSVLFSFSLNSFCIMTLPSFLVLCDVWQIPVIFTKIKTVTDYKVVGDGEQRVVGIEFYHSAAWFVQKCDELQRFGIACLEQFAHFAERATAVDDVLNDDNMIVTDVMSEVLGDGNTAGRTGGVVVAFCLYEVHLARHGYLTEKIRKEHKCTFEYAHHEYGCSIVQGVYQLTCFFYFPAYFVFADEHPLYPVAVVIRTVARHMICLLNKK